MVGEVFLKNISKVKQVLKILLLFFFSKGDTNERGKKAFWDESCASVKTLEKCLIGN